MQDRDESDQQANQRVVSSTPLVTPTETPLETPSVTPIHTPSSSPRSRLRTEDFLSTDWFRSSQPSIVSDISLAINSLPVKAAISLPNIHLLSTRKKTTMSYQAFDRSLRMYTKLEKEVQKSIGDLVDVIQNDKGKYEVKKLIDIIEVDREALKEAGEEVNNYDPTNVNPSFKEE